MSSTSKSCHGRRSPWLATNLVHVVDEEFSWVTKYLNSKSDGVTCGFTCLGLSWWYHDETRTKNRHDWSRQVLACDLVTKVETYQLDFYAKNIASNYFSFANFVLIFIRVFLLATQMAIGSRLFIFLNTVFEIRWQTLSAQFILWSMLVVNKFPRKKSRIAIHLVKLFNCHIKWTIIKIDYDEYADILITIRAGSLGSYGCWYINRSLNSPDHYV